LLQFAAAKLRTLEHEQWLQVNMLLFNVIEAKEKDEDPVAKLLPPFLGAGGAPEQAVRPRPEEANCRCVPPRSRPDLNEPWGKEALCHRFVLV
jgi:hypothetical protein